MIIDGRAIARDILAETKARTEKLQRRPNVLMYVSPNETPATRSYVNMKAKSAEEAGCDLEETKSLTFSSRADAIIVQLPLPPELSVAEILNSIPLEQDADVLSSAARQKFERGDEDALLPPVVGAVRKILISGGIEVKNKKAVVIGNGWLVGAPVATWLIQQGAQVEVVPNKTKEISAILRTADIIVSGAGSPHFITPDMLKENVVLIDAGTSELGGTISGDADPSCAEKCSIFTPVPGGVGPIAVAYLFENVVTLAERTMNI